LGEALATTDTPMKQPLYLSRQVSTEAYLSKRLQYHHNRITMLIPRKHITGSTVSFRVSTLSGPIAI